MQTISTATFYSLTPRYAQQTKVSTIRKGPDIFHPRLHTTFQTVNMPSYTSICSAVLDKRQNSSTIGFTRKQSRIDLFLPGEPMHNHSITEDSVCFIPVESLCKGPPITCSPGLDVVSMARTMHDHDISCLIVIENERPVSVVSIRECRNIIADNEGNLSGLTVRDIMMPDLVTIRRREPLFHAIFKMSQLNIHRLAVVNDDGTLFGVITDTDLIRIKTNTPLYLTQELETANSVEELQAIGNRMLDMVRYATQTGADTQSLVQLISHFNDAFTLRAIELLEQHEVISLPARAAYLALGSEGRGEQTLRTDQDSAIVYRDDLTEEGKKQAQLFASRLVEVLEELGVPRCPGNTMVSNPDWFRSLSDWQRLVEVWISTPTPDHMVNFGMFQDLRVLHGEEELGQRLQQDILTAVKRFPLYLPNMARHIVRFPPPIGMFGRLKVERSGENKGMIDIKKAGIFAITVGSSLLVLETGRMGGSTWDKLALLKGKGIVSTKDSETVSTPSTTWSVSALNVSSGCWHQGRNHQTT